MSKQDGAIIAGSCLGAVFIVLINLLWVGALIYGVVQGGLWLARN